ncbi:MAG: polyprenyl synthetase family protein [Alloprevotella sp.]|nr:polyprenyl synthetase family protein [Alloprevotella sp.]
MLQKIENALAAIRYPIIPEGLYEPIAYTLSAGGKRLRPTLLLMAYGLYRDDVETALPAAIAIETYHNHTLLHDDLMDNADVRRGRPTVHRRWDANTAVLSGDEMLIMAFRHMLRQPVKDAARKAGLLALFADTMQEICEGQQFDMNFEQREDVTEAEYVEMIRLKTSVLLACALKAGAIIAGAPARDADLLYQFGEKVGLAFQLQDDYLDCYGDPAVFGKQIGGDIQCGKKTFLLISALQRADEGQREALLSRNVERVLACYDALGVPQLCRDKIDAIYGEARRAFDALPLPRSRKQALWDYAESMMNRKK